jgi:voltage-gated potassium channel
MNLSWVDAAYMTLITLTTVGYTEVTPAGVDRLTPEARVFTMAILLAGMGILLYVFSSATAFIVEGELSDIFRRRNMEKKIAELEGHTIVCGIGHIGRYVIEELIKTLRPFVVVDNNKEEIDRYRELLGEFLYVLGDASEDVVLQQAGIMRASGLVTTFGDDKMNLFVTLSARNLNPRVRIVARAVDPQSVEKLKRTGADSVVSTNLIGGMRMISELVRPAVVGFLDIMLRDQRKTLRVEEAKIGEGSELVGMTLGEAAIQERTTMAVVAIRDGQTKEYVYLPAADTILKAGDDLIVMGDVSRLSDLKKLARTPHIGLESEGVAPGRD